MSLKLLGEVERISESIPDRIVVMDNALYADRLLLPEYYTDAANAIKNDDKVAFYAVCSNAGIPASLSEQLFTALTAVTDYNKFW